MPLHSTRVEEMSFYRGSALTTVHAARTSYAMASEKPKQGDKSPPGSAPFQWNNEEPQHFYPQDGTDDLAGIFGDVAQPAPLFPTRDLYGVPQTYTLEMPSPVIKDDVFHCPETGLGYLYKPVSDFSYLLGNENESGHYHALGDSSAAANIHANDLDNCQIERNTVPTWTDLSGDLQISKVGREENAIDICRPWLIPNQISHAAIGAESEHNPNSGELGMNISQMCNAGGEAIGKDIHMPWLAGKQFIHAGSAPVLGRNPIDEESRINNSFMTGVAQSNHPEILDGNFLTLGYGTNMETRSKNNVSSKDSNQSTEKIDRPMLNTSSCQSVARSSLNSSSNIASGFSSFQKHAGGFSKVAQNKDGFKSIGQAQNDDGFSSLGQNAGGISQQARNVIEFSSKLRNIGGFSSPVQNVRGFSSPLLNVSGFSHQVGGLSKPSRNESAGTLLPLVDEQNYNHIISSWNSGLGEKRKERFANIDPNTSFHGFPTEFSIPQNNSNQVGIPNAACFTETRLQSSSAQPSFHGFPTELSILPNNSNQVGIPNAVVFRETRLQSSSSQPAFYQQQNPHIGAVPNFSQEPSVVTTSIARQYQSGNLGQSQASVPVQASRSLSVPVHTPGQEIVAVNTLSQSSNVPPGPSLKKRGPISPLNVPQPRRRKTRSTKPTSHLSALTVPQLGLPHAPPPSIDSLSPSIVQTAPSRPPIAQTVPSHPPVPQTIPSCAPIGRTFLLPSFPRTSSSRHIKWQVEDRTPPSGNQCHICKRDLSYPPEGPIYQPEKPISAAVLPCGHHFHDSCLQRITPPNQAQNPPCIPCAMGEKN